VCLVACLLLLAAIAMGAGPQEKKRAIKEGTEAGGDGDCSGGAGRSHHRIDDGLLGDGGRPGDRLPCVAGTADCGFKLIPGFDSGLDGKSCRIQETNARSSRSRRGLLRRRECLRGVLQEVCACWSPVTFCITADRVGDDVLHMGSFGPRRGVDD